jgi:tetratricopeptide (TPR) repeat protein
MHRLVWSLSLLLSISSCVMAARADDAVDCFSIGNQDYFKPELFEHSVQGCTRLIAVRTGKPLAEAYSARGSWLHKEKKYDSALADFDRALAIDPTNVEFYDYRGDTLMAKSDLDGALANYDRAIRIDPNYAAAQYSRGMVYQIKGDIERARESYRAVLALPKSRPNFKGPDRIQEWAQDNANKQLERLNATNPGK